MANLWEIAVVVVLVAVLLPAANLAYSDQADATTVEETMTVEHGESVAVDVDAAVYGEEVTISGDGELEHGVDYRWDAGFGAVFWPTDSDASDGSEVTIEYTYYESDETTDSIATVIGSVGWLMWALVFLTIISTLIAWMGFGRGGGW